ncbi:hypothetical protein M3201_06970 [Paenibacillus motobuensis]|uniref:imm11 family protein n=1 Tax=Paenibacillus TaxID=44249 RepID=UPI00203E5D22|nr:MULTISPECIES: DUF1629 domain-containing protein [Paenibacillus]MCM3039443.1 hypothetical protein [Paenibacillus lutimineralis]MCM3646547.1 hypothetical protein [Paenibacillus motobuensis]
MKVWRWGYESDKYDSFTFPNRTEVREKYFDPYFNGTIIGDKWGEVPFETYRSRKPCDCTGIGSHIPIFGERAVEVLAPYLNSNVELLPLKHPSKAYYAINVIRFIDALDYDNSVIEYVEGHPGFIDHVHQFAFKLDAIQEYPIFKIPEFKRLSIFVTDTFKEAVEANGLKGFTFELLWDSEMNIDAEAELERQYQEALAAAELNKGEEFSFDEAIKRMEAGESLASGPWRLQQAPDGTVRLGNLQADGSYNWIQPIFYPPVLLDLKWHVVNPLPVK